MPTESNECLPESQGRHKALHIALIILLGVLIIVPSFFSRDLWNPDEPRYMEVAREMVVRGDYVVPHLDNIYYPDKPPMFFWLAAGLYNLGLGNLSGRTVAGMAMIGTLLMIYAFGRRKFSARAGLLAAFITATTLLFFGLMKTGVIDPVLTFLETAAILTGYCALTGSASRSRLWWLAFYAFCGLAMLAKGPVGFVLPGLLILVFALFNRKSVSSGGWMHLAGVALMAVIFCSWLLPAMSQGGPEYKRALLGQTGSYTVNRVVSHAHGPHYYFMQLPFYLLPWAFVFVLALVQAIQDWRRKGDREAAFLSLWFLCTLAFFTAVTAKRERYLLPLMPAAGLLCARYFMLTAKNGFPWPRLHRWFATAVYGIFALLGCVFILFPIIGNSLLKVALSGDPEMLERGLAISASFGLGILLPLGILILAASLAGLAIGRARSSWLIGISIGIILTFSLVMDLVFVPKINPVKSSKLFGQRILPYLNAADEKYLFAHDYSGVINLYTGMLDIPLLEIDRSNSSQAAKPRDHKKEDRNAQVLALLNKTFAHGGKIAVVSDEQQVAVFVDQLPPNIKIVARELVGHRGMICLANWGEADNGK